MSSHVISAEDISEVDYEELSQASNQSQFKFEENSDPNFENDSDYLPESEDESSQEFSQVHIWEFLFCSTGGLLGTWRAVAFLTN